MALKSSLKAFHCLKQSTTPTTFYNPISIPHIFLKLYPIMRRGLISNTKPTHLRTVTLEVERKFTPTPSSITRLRENSSTHPFKSHTYLGSKPIHDIYYDAACRLMDKGIYIRTRNGAWEAKTRKGGDLVNSQCCEVSGYGSVTRILQDAVGREWKPDMLGKVAEWKMERMEWEVEGFGVVVDESVFEVGVLAGALIVRHCVGEVELCRGVEGGGEEEVGREMDGRIERFMRDHGDVFPVCGGMAQGKLSAYFECVERLRGVRDGPHLG
ncbi:hypothetical protein P153DRAFT_355692 [Dothidotthia symphoricarpi CBS 119687]|uniref:CYTH domain-containing protein n=1 Tax=Dothidotthia symphoricarpi CBS 119687 TaxID=1392245 RepID=A0A6A6AFY2_9PLEO|nr:uncharacterized protein P153DRAFT_355692 [Dothidotthia symphoricarpi CBS 119687]KAF2130882.1 hypothetical protein P153DRAFT_355692 [Dothidotthia symphoricarpi CBS 119687]